MTLEPIQLSLDDDRIRGRQIAAGIDGRRGNRRCHEFCVVHDAWPIRMVDMPPTSFWARGTMSVSCLESSAAEHRPIYIEVIEIARICGCLAVACA